MAAGPAAFMSYVRFDDAHDDGQLSAFRERLAAEVRMQTGDEFPIFQDRNDIAWGQNWRQRIEETLDAVTLLLVIITPGLFKSTACRDEVARFRERETELGRDDLILPVYYVSAKQMDDPESRKADELATLLWSRQYADWRELRFEPLTSPVVRKAIAALASRMRDAHDGATAAAAPAVAPASGTHRPVGSRTGPRGASAAAEAGVVHQRLDGARTEPPTHVVDAYQRGDFVSVRAAIEAARPGDRILVRPGLYEESLVVDKPLEIIGDGPVEDIEIRGRNSNVLDFSASIGRVANLTLRAVGDQSWGVSLRQGRLDLEGCDISSQGGSCVYVAGGADPRLRRNKIHHAKFMGVSIYTGGLGTLEDNEITGNVKAGVTISEGADPVLRRNHIHDNKGIGASVHRNGLGTLEDNDISGNGGIGVAISGSSAPVLRRNQIRDNTAVGVLVDDDGLGTLEDNEITGNGVGVQISNGGNPTMRGNRIMSNARQGVLVKDGGKGVLEDNDLTGNAGGAWLIDKSSVPNVTRARNTE